MTTAMICLWSIAACLIAEWRPGMVWAVSAHIVDDDRMVNASRTQAGGNLRFHAKSRFFLAVVRAVPGIVRVMPVPTGGPRFFSEPSGVPL